MTEPTIDFPQIEDVCVATERSTHPSPTGLYPAYGRWSSEEVSAIMARLFTGESMSMVARSLGTNHMAISRLVSELGVRDALVTCLNSANARMAAELFNRTRRLRTLATIADELDRTIDEHQTEPFEAKELRDLAVTAGVLIDKQRLEDGESTNNQSVQVRVWGRRELPASSNNGSSTST